MDTSPHNGYATSTADLVWRFIDECGPKSPREIEEAMTGKRGRSDRDIRVAMQSLLDDGRIRLDNDLKLFATRAPPAEPVARSLSAHGAKVTVELSHDGIPIVTVVVNKVDERPAHALVIVNGGIVYAAPPPRWAGLP